VKCNNINFIQRAFLVDSSDTYKVLATLADGYNYLITVPICDSDATNGNYNDANIVQSSGSSSWSLGKLDFTSWVLGTRGGLTALSVSYTDGTADDGCPSTTGGVRISTVILVCDSTYTIVAPNIIVSELSICTCE
jgi:energy-converting hydrogenase Eha subunit B